MENKSNKERRDIVAEKLKHNSEPTFEKNEEAIEALITDFAEKVAELGCYAIALSVAFPAKNENTGVQGYIGGNKRWCAEITLNMLKAMHAQKEKGCRDE